MKGGEIFLLHLLRFCAGHKLAAKVPARECVLLLCTLL